MRLPCRGCIDRYCETLQDCAKELKRSVGAYPRREGLVSSWDPRIACSSNAPVLVNRQSLLSLSYPLPSLISSIPSSHPLTGPIHLPFNIQTLLQDPATLRRRVPKPPRQRVNTNPRPRLFPSLSSYSNQHHRHSPPTSSLVQHGRQNYVSAIV